MTNYQSKNDKEGANESYQQFNSQNAIAPSYQDYLLSRQFIVPKQGIQSQISNNIQVSSPQINKPKVQLVQSPTHCSNCQNCQNCMNVKCFYHKEQNITNFCRDVNCLMPLCPYCVEIHQTEHVEKGEFALFETIEVVYNRCCQQIVELQQNFSNEQENFNLFVNGYSSFGQTIDEKITEAKNLALRKVDAQFEDFRREINQKFGIQNDYVRKEIQTAEKCFKSYESWLHGVQLKLQDKHEFLKQVIKLSSMDYCGDCVDFLELYRQSFATLEQNLIQLEIDESQIGLIDLQKGAHLINGEYYTPSNVSYLQQFFEKCGTRQQRAAQVKKLINDMTLGGTQIKKSQLTTSQSLSQIGKVHGIKNVRGLAKSRSPELFAFGGQHSGRINSNIFQHRDQMASFGQAHQTNFVKNQGQQAIIKEEQNETTNISVTDKEKQGKQQLDNLEQTNSVLVQNYQSQNQNQNTLKQPQPNFVYQVPRVQSSFSQQLRPMQPSYIHQFPVMLQPQLNQAYQPQPVLYPFPITTASPTMKIESLVPVSMSPTKRIQSQVHPLAPSSLQYSSDRVIAEAQRLTSQSRELTKNKNMLSKITEEDGKQYPSQSRSPSKLLNEDNSQSIQNLQKASPKRILVTNPQNELLYKQDFLLPHFERQNYHKDSAFNNYVVGPQKQIFSLSPNALRKLHGETGIRVDPVTKLDTYGVDNNSRVADSRIVMPQPQYSSTLYKQQQSLEDNLYAWEKNALERNSLRQRSSERKKYI